MPPKIVTGLSSLVWLVIGLVVGCWHKDFQAGLLFIAVAIYFRLCAIGCNVEKKL